MKRKMLITITLIITMLLNCILPITQVRAATNDVEITLNGNLYNAVKANLQSQGITAEYNDAQRTLKISQEALDSVTTLNLSNFAISDLTGLEIFKNVTSVDLSANKLTEESHLEVLDNLVLSFLDISSNEIADVSMIQSFDSISKVNLHNQKFTRVEIVEVDDSEESNQVDSATFELPKILSKATQDGIINPDWLIEEKEASGPYIYWTTFNGVEVEIVTGDKTDTTFSPRYGMVTLRIKITDPQNPLYNSDINLFYVTVSSEERGIIFRDKNLYNAVKDQLKQDQKINSDLYKETNSRNLYKRYYDEPMVLVVTIDDLINNIPSLLVSDKQIKDLTGIEKFVGLEKELNVSNNYIEDISRIIDLKTEKEAEEAKLRERFQKQQQLIKEIVDKMEAERKTIEENDEKIKNATEEIKKLTEQYATADDNAKKTIESQIKSKNEEIKNASLAKAEAEAKFNSYKGKLEERMEKMYKIYKKEYLVTNILTPELARQTTEEFKNMTKEEAKSKLDAQYTRMGTLEERLTNYEKQYLINKFSIPTKTTTQTTVTNPDGSSSQETVTKDIENPIKTYFDDLKDLTKDAEIAELKSKILEFKQIAEIFKMANYCFTERLYNSTTDCLAEEYIAKQKEMKELDGEDTSILDYVEKNLAQIKSDLNTAGNSCQGSVTFATNFDDIYAIAKRLANVTSEEIADNVKIPQLKYLDISVNLIESLEGIDQLVELKGLYAGDNEICNIENINWAAMEKLLELDLSFNDISNIKPLEVIKSLKRLSVAKNLIEGAFDFNFSGMPDLEYFDLSQNKIDDIQYLRNQLIYVARGEGYDDISGYLKSGKFDIKLYGQILTMNIEVTNEKDLTYVDIPNIFRQAEELDYDRTSFAVNSVYGNATNDGKQAILETSIPGTYQASIYITTGTFRGDSHASSSGIAYNTTCTIYYTVVDSGKSPVNPNENTVNNDVVENNVNNDVNNEVVVNNDVVENNVENNVVDNNTENSVVNNNVVDNNVDDNTIKLGYKTEEEYVVGISPNTKVYEFLNKLTDETETYDAEVKSNGEVVDEDAVVKTSMMVVIYDVDKPIAVYEIVVKGDVNGDGIADAVDSGLIKAHRAEVTILTGAYEKAGDINDDGIIDAIDARLLLYHRAEVPGYIL